MDNRKQKHVASLVLCAFMFMLIAWWGNWEAGERARSPIALCGGAEAAIGLSQQLGFAATAEDIFKILRPGGAAETRQDACRREIFLAQVRADRWVVVGIAGFFVAIFFFVGALLESPRWAFLVVPLGLVLTLAFAYGDFGENGELTHWVHLASQQDPGPRATEPLQWFFLIKLGALALASLALCVFWRSRSNHLIVVFPRICALAAAGVLAWAIHGKDETLAQFGLAAVFVVALLGMFHALLVAVIPERRMRLKNSSLEAAP